MITITNFVKSLPALSQERKLLQTNLRNFDPNEYSGKFQIRDSLDSWWDQVMTIEMKFPSPAKLSSFRKQYYSRKGSDILL